MALVQKEGNVLFYQISINASVRNSIRGNYATCVRKVTCPTMVIAIPACGVETTAITEENVLSLKSQNLFNVFVRANIKEHHVKIARSRVIETKTVTASMVLKKMTVLA